MYQEKSSKLFTKYALPQMLGLLLNSIYLIVDGIFIGNRLGRQAMAAAAVSVPVIEILIAISMAISVGAGILISNYLGEEKEERARATFNNSIKLMGLVSIFIVVLGNLFIREIAYLLGANDLIVDEAVIYLGYIISFSPALLYSFLFSGLARNNNDPKLAMLALVVGSLSNIFLDYVFMYPLNMGIGGAALATALGPIFSVLILLPSFSGKKSPKKKLYFQGSRPSKKETRAIFKLGFPAFIMEFSIGIVSLIYNFGIKHYGYGEIGLASYLIIGYLALIVLTLFLGIAQGLQPIFSYFNGKKDYKKIRELFAYSLRKLLGLGLLAYLVIFFFGAGFVGLFTSSDLELRAFTVGKLRLYFWGFSFAAINILIISYFQSLKNFRIALLISLLRSIIFLPILMGTLPRLEPGLIWSLVSISEILTSIFAGYYYKKIKLGKDS